MISQATQQSGCLTSVEKRTAVLASSFALDVGPGLIAGVIAVLSASFYKNMSLEAVSG